MRGIIKHILESNDMKENIADSVKQKVDESAAFYGESFLDFDYKLASLNFRTFKPFFRGGACLEIGPASGFMTKELVAEFETVDIIDASGELLDQVPYYENVVKHHSLLEEFLTDTKFDTIIMSHVLEHIHKPVDVCARIRDWLADDGVFLVSVPNANSIHRLAAVEMGMLESQYELNQRDHDLGHYRVYDAETLKNHLEEAGFHVKVSGGTFFKPLSNGQIEANWTDEMIEGFYKLGHAFPDHCAEIYVVCGK